MIKNIGFHIAHGVADNNGIALRLVTCSEHGNVQIDTAKPFPTYVLGIGLGEPRVVGLTCEGPFDPSMEDFIRTGVIDYDRALALAVPTGNTWENRFTIVHTKRPSYSEGRELKIERCWQ